MSGYSATVRFTDPEREDLFHTADTPDKARIEALQKAKLTGAEPEVVFWDTDGEQLAMTWPDEVRTTRAEYERQAETSP